MYDYFSVNKLSRLFFTMLQITGCISYINSFTKVKLPPNVQDIMITNVLSFAAPRWHSHIPRMIKN